MSEYPQPRLTALGDQATALMRRAERRTLTSERCCVPRVAAELSQLTKSDIDWLNATRRSIRSYAPDPVPRADLLRICRAGAESTIVPADPGTGTAARWLVLARAVEDTDPGLHEYRDGDLTPATAMPSDEALAGLSLGQFATAPCIIQPLWDLGAAVAAAGADGYLNQLLQNGFGLHAAHLVATRLGLGSCMIRGIHPATLAAAGSWGALDFRPFLALSLGRITPGETGQ